MKNISIVIPCFNEEGNIIKMYKAVTSEMKKWGGIYDYEILFIDNHSLDESRNILRSICNGDYKVKAIFNTRNFGPFNSPYYGLLESTGDCAILLSCDFQEPVNLISQFISGWEQGYKIVVGKKTKSCENLIMYKLRSFYYWFVKKWSDVELIGHFNGFGLYDRTILETLKSLDEPMPFLRGLVCELGFKRLEIEYTQNKRVVGKSSFNLYRYYDAAMLGITSYTKVGLRVATLFGFLCTSVSFVTAIVYLIYKLICWDRFIAGTAPILIGMLFLGAVQLLFFGILGEYVLNISQRLKHRPLVIEEERLNFDNDEIAE